MKVVLKLFLTLLAFSTFIDKSLSITNHQINKICRNEKQASTCIKNLKKKRYNLQKGNLIEIPVIPYRR